MTHQRSFKICSGAAPEKVRKDLALLAEFEDEGVSLGALNGLLKERLIPHLMRYDRPGFQSMFNSFPEKGAAFGARIALAYNQGVTNWQVSPGGAMLEELCCRALCRLFGLPAGADATFMYAGTYANQEALYLALCRRAEAKGFDFGRKGFKGFRDPSRLAVLASEDAHFSIRAAVRMLGLGDESLVSMPVDENFRLDDEYLRNALPKLVRNRDIFCVVATAGTTSTGAVDPIGAIADLCARNGLWLHVDGAYGLAYSLVPEWAPLFSGYERADSITWDPHKQLAVPIPSSILFVRRRKEFARMALHSAYFNKPDDPVPNPGLKSPPSTRMFAALSLVTSLRHQGMAKVVERLRAPLVAVRELAHLLEKKADIELFHQPDTGILCFRFLNKDLSESGHAGLQQHIYDGIMRRGERTISLIDVRGKKALRLVAVSPKVTAEALKETIAEIRRRGKEYRP